MRVRVGEARQDRAAAPVDALHARVSGHQLGRRPERGHAAVADEQRGVVEDRAGLVGRDDRRVVDQLRDLAKRLDELCDRAEFQTGWYLKDLATGATANRRGDVPVPSASTRKISIMMAALAAVHAGKLSLDQRVTIEAKYQDNDSGTF